MDKETADDVAESNLTPNEDQHQGEDETVEASIQIEIDEIESRKLSLKGAQEKEDSNEASGKIDDSDDLSTREVFNPPSLKRSDSLDLTANIFNDTDNLQVKLKYSTKSRSWNEITPSEVTASPQPEPQSQQSQQPETQSQQPEQSQQQQPQSQQPEQSQQQQPQAQPEAAESGQASGKPSDDSTFTTSLQPLIKETEVVCDPNTRVWQNIDSAHENPGGLGSGLGQNMDSRSTEGNDASAASQKISDKYSDGIIRKNLIASITNSMEEQHRLADYNIFLQNKVGEYYRKKFCEFGTAIASVQDLHGLPSDKKFKKYMIVISSMHKERYGLIYDLDSKRNEGKKQVMDIQKRVCEKYEEFLSYRKKIVSKAIDERKKPIPEDTWKIYFDNELETEERIKKIRIPCIKIELNIGRMNNAQEEKEKDSGGFRMIDYEQLRTENLALVNQMELHIKEIKKLKAKNLKLLSILAHCREKTFFLTHLKRFNTTELTNLENDLNSTRNNLHKLKMERDSTKKDNDNLRRKSGLLGRESLQYHFQDVIDNMREKKKKVNSGIEEWMELKKKIFHYQSTVQSLKNNKSVNKTKITLPQLAIRLSDQYTQM